MPVDFKRIQGPASSSAANFERLCSQLIAHEFPKARAVEGKGGDEGVDAFVGHLGGLDSTEVVFQFKFFTETLTASRRKQIEDSLATAFTKHTPKKWILCLPKSLTPAEHRWWEALGSDNPDTELHLWDETILTQLLLKHPDVREEFFAERFTEAQETQLRKLMLELVSPLPEDMAFLLQLSKLAVRTGSDANKLQSEILEWCLAAKEPLDLGIRSLLISDFEAARDNLAKSIHADEAMLSQKKLLLGNSHLCLRETDAAIRTYEESLLLDERNLATLTNLGAAYRFSGAPDKAEGVYKQALSIDESVPQVHNNLGVAQESQDRFGDAIVSYSRALELDKDCFPALFNRAMAHGLAGNFEQAVADFESANESIEKFRDLEAMGSRNPLFPFKSLGSLLLEGIHPILKEAQRNTEDGSAMVFSLGGGGRASGREPLLSYPLPQGLTSGVLSQSVLMFYNYSPRNLASMRDFIVQYCKGRHAKFSTQNVRGVPMPRRGR